MAQILIRNVEDDLVKEIKRLAIEHGRSLQKEAQMLLVQGLEAVARRERHERAVKALDRLRKQQLKRRKGVPFPSSVEMIRRAREGR